MRFSDPGQVDVFLDGGPQRRNCHSPEPIRLQQPPQIVGLQNQRGSVTLRQRCSPHRLAYELIIEAQRVSNDATPTLVVDVKLVETQLDPVVAPPDRHAAVLRAQNLPVFYI